MYTVTRTQIVLSIKEFQAIHTTMSILEEALYKNNTESLDIDAPSISKAVTTLRKFVGSCGVLDEKEKNVTW
jgi:hypothetical protein